MAKLQGLTVLVTRPYQQSQPIIQLCQDAGANTWWTPIIDIVPEPWNPILEAAIDILKEADWVIFTSANAVQCAMPFIQARYAQFPATVKVATIGHKTAAILQQYGVVTHLLPATDYTSEGLLQALAQYPIAYRVMIHFTGKAGLTILRDALIAKHATVITAEVYQRLPIQNLDTELITQLEQDAIDVILVSSGEILSHFVALYKGSLNARLVFIVASQRIADLGIQLGIPKRQFVVAKSAHDMNMLNALINWRIGESNE